MSGGWSTILRAVLEHMFFGPKGFCNGGSPVLLNGQHRLVFARLTNVLSDGDGLRQAWDWKGASSLHPCFKHPNVFRLGSDLAARRPGYVEMDCFDVCKFRSWSAAELFSAADTVAEAENRMLDSRITKTMFNEIEQSLGLNSNKHGMLMSPMFRPDLSPALPELRRGPKRRDLDQSDLVARG